MIRAAARPSRRPAPWAHVLPLATIALASGLFCLLASNLDQAPAPPSEPAAQPSAAPDTTSPVIHVAADGAISFGGEPMIEEVLQLHLLDLARKGTRRVRIETGGFAPRERVAQIERFCREAGIPDVGIVPDATNATGLH